MCIRSADRRGPLYAGLMLIALAGAISAASAQGYPSTFSFGESPSDQEVAAVAIAVPADGRGLPPGSGDYGKGKQIYETACAACHGADLKGVAGLPDMPSGAALRLIGGRGTLTHQKPILTVESYWPYATILFDYTRRSMPFTAPGSLTADEVYAVCAYILAEANIIERTAVMDRNTLPKVQMPNRDGFIPDPRPEVFR
jgi:cytochrome c